MKRDNFYSLSKSEKIEAFNEIQRKTQLPAATIEKDWWVVQTLEIVFEMDVARHLIFKGGTSLSKAWKLVERFSEDIDLALAREFLGFPGDISRTQVGKLRDASFEYVSEQFLPDLVKGFDEAGMKDVSIYLTDVTTPDQDPVRIAIQYPAVTSESTYVAPQVVLEVGGRALREPFTICRFSSLIGEHFSGEDFADDEIEVPCVNPERTFLEKLFLLHEEFQRPKEKVRVERLSRHLYDVFQIAKTGYKELAFDNFDLYKEIVEHRYKFSRLSGVDYESHYPPRLNPLPPAELIDSWEKDYKVMQDEMIYGESIPFKTLVESIRKMIDEFNRKGF